MQKVISLLLIGLVASLAVVVVSPAGAKKGHPKGTAAAKRHAVGGVVQSVASDSVTLTRKKGDPVTVQGLPAVSSGPTDPRGRPSPCARRP